MLFIGIAFGMLILMIFFLVVILYALSCKNEELMDRLMASYDTTGHINYINGKIEKEKHNKKEKKQKLNENEYKYPV